MKQKRLFVLIAICVACMQVFAQKQDTLYTKRVFLTTHFYKDAIKLSNRKVAKLFSDTWQPRIKHKWSNVLKPIGSVLIIGGVGLTYVAVKGVNYITTLEGRRVEAKMINLSQLSSGVGLVVVGYSVIESSNLLAYRSVNVYNSMLKASRKTSYINKIQFGLTESNTIGFSMLLN